ncbi:MAG: c-type cytochrome biogenesis protein CcmI [Rhodospirillaceae bacterium]|nr:c-type cytochrome biogenesis protein CcmI [Rhodospirillaceae bacterium]
MIWALLAGLALAVVAALIWPLVRDAGAPDDAPRDVVVLKDQLAEIDRDLARGVISATEAEALKLEIQRRLLAAARRPALAVWREGAGMRSALTALLAVAVPMLAFAVYMNLGAPTLKATDNSAGHQSQQDPEMAGLVEQLAARMANEPDNIEGWALLARSYRQMERYGEALEAYRHVLALNPPDAEAYANYGEMSVTVAGGTVNDDAREAFTNALQRDRSDPRSRFYLGLAAAQSGDAKAAIAIWRDLTADAPPDAPWLEMVRGQMFQVAQSAAIMPVNVDPKHPLDLKPGETKPSESKAAPVAPAKPAPQAAVAPPTVAPPSDPEDITSPDVSAIKEQFSAENLAQIQAMVGSLAGRLENEPEDFNGWMMLGRSYMVLRNSEGAKRAFEKAIALKPGELQPKLSYAGVLMNETNLNSPAPLPENLVKTSNDILKLVPDHAEALFVRGVAAFKRGDKKAAARDFEAAKKNARGNLPAELDRWLAAL